VNVCSGAPCNDYLWHRHEDTAPGALRAFAVLTQLIEAAKGAITSRDLHGDDNSRFSRCASILFPASCTTLELRVTNNDEGFSSLVLLFVSGPISSTYPEHTYHLHNVSLSQRNIIAVFRFLCTPIVFTMFLCDNLCDNQRVSRVAHEVSHHRGSFAGRDVKHFILLEAIEKRRKAH
jgi:hypothetical protein